MEQLSLLPKVYEYGENLSSEEMNQIVQHLNSSIEAINYLLAKNNGINDGHCEMRYKVSAQQPEAPAAGSDGKSNGWSDTYTKPDTDNGEITWMTLCFLNGDGVYGAWSNPVCITWGSIEGQRGRQGEAGVRGSFKSRVFKRQNTRPDTPTGGTYDNPIPTSGGWTDGIPQGSAIIWSSVCTFHGDGTSSGWSSPAPESDNATLDIEFSPLTIQPSAPIGNTPFANHESEGWYDSNSVNFESAGTMIWRAERKVSNGEYDGDWTITRIYGEKGEKGDPGNAGGHHEFRYRNYIPSEQYPTPSKPATGSNGTTDGWSETQQPLSETDIKNGSATWMTQCYVNDEGEYGEWTPPIRITGANGLDGEDGTIIEFVYALKTSVWSNPTPPPTTQVDDWSGTTSDGTVWRDNPQGVSENAMYEYISQRSKINNVWTAYSTPVIWSKWGEKGMDGDGVEYIFKRFTGVQSWGDNNENPAHWSISQSREYRGPEGHQWTDDPTGVTSTYLYEYVSVRYYRNEQWGAYSTPALWAKYGQDGSQGGQGPQGPGGKYYVKQYKRHNSRLSVDDSGWSDTAPEPNDSYPYIWERSCLYNPATNQYEGNWSYVCLTGKEGLNGSNGSDGSSITGPAGPMYYPAGEYQSNTTYTVTDKLVPVVLYKPTNGSYNYYYAKHTTSAAPTDSDAWGAFENFEVMFVDVLFASYAHLGAFIINGDYFMSQKGTGSDGTTEINYYDVADIDNDFNPYLMMDAKTGRLWARRGSIGGFDISDKYIGNNSPSTAQNGYTFIHKDGFMHLSKPSNGEALRVSGTANILGTLFTDQTSLQNINGAPLQLNVNANNNAQTIIGNSQSTVEVQAEKSTFTEDVEIQGDAEIWGKVLIEGAFIPKGSVVTGELWNGDYYFTLPSNPTPTKGQCYFCKCIANGKYLHISTSTGYSIMVSDSQQTETSISLGKDSAIVVYFGNNIWVLYKCN